MTVLVLFVDDEGNLMGAVADALGCAEHEKDAEHGQDWWLPSTGMRCRPNGAPTSRYPARLVRKFINVPVGNCQTPVLVCGSVRTALRLRDEVGRVDVDEADFEEGEIPMTARDAALGGALYHALRAIQQHEPNVDLGYATPSGRWIFNQVPGIPDHNPPPLPYFGRVILLGSGAESVRGMVRERADEFGRERESADELEARDPTAIGQANHKEANAVRLSRIVHSMTALLLDEDRSPASRTLPHQVGGYYEGYVVDENVLRPIGSAWTVFAVWEWDQTQPMLRIEAIWLHAYIDDVLHVLSAPSLSTMLDPDPPFGEGKLKMTLLWQDLTCSVIQPIENDDGPIQRLAPVEVETDTKMRVVELARSSPLRLRLETRSLHDAPLQPHNTQARRPMSVRCRWTTITQENGPLFRVFPSPEGIQIGLQKPLWQHYRARLMDAAQRKRPS